MKRKLLLLAVLLCAIAWANPVVKYHNAMLKRAVLAAAEGERVTLSEIVPFGWERVYTFSPYATREEMEETIGFRSRALRETVNEGMVQLVFVDGGRVTASVCAYPQALGYAVWFQGEIAYGDAVFFTVRQADGIVVLTEETL